MRRTIIVTTALAALLIAGVASATTPYTGPTINKYTASLTVSPKAAGSASAPSPVSFLEKLTAKNANSALNAGPLTDIDLKIYGLVSNYKDFKTCSFAKILAAANDSGCPKGALVAQGPINTILGQKTLSPSGSFACNPRLDVWNAGGGKVVEFFVTTLTPGSKYYCDGVKTGSAPPYVATIKQSGKYLIQNTPLPPSVSTNVIGSLYGSLVLENLTWLKTTVKVNGKPVPYIASVACKASKRPWSVTFIATNGIGSQSETVSGADKC
ncbi:MAG: hypothetical protein ACLP0J_03025 [Solirubrobacteraceae bacterium]